jgi:hypothetical protein
MTERDGGGDASTREVWQCAGREFGDDGYGRSTMTITLARRYFSAVAIVAALVVSVCTFVGLSHGLLHEPMATDHGGPMQEEVITFCLVLFTVLMPFALAMFALAKRFAWRARAHAAAFTGSLVYILPALGGGGARASPAWLQRFQN